MSKICCFTGSREMASISRRDLANKLENLIVELIEKEGYTDFRAGGARGFDTLAALVVLKLREKYPNIKLHLFLPCKNQEKLFSNQEQHFYRLILQRADTYFFVQENYSNSAMFARNRALVNGADLCIALPLSAHGGTQYTVGYARKQGVPIINLKNI